MKRITLHRITLQNFKGAENETYDFNGQDAVVSGKNGSGKTTIFYHKAAITLQLCIRGQFQNQA